MTTTTSNAKGHAARFDAFVKTREGQEPAWLTELRRSAMARVVALGIPDTKHEDWKWTSLKPLHDLGLGHVEAAAANADVDEALLADLSFDGLDAVRVVLVNGTFVPELSGTAPAGIEVTPLVTAADASERVRQTLARVAPYEHRAFLALNTAFMGDGALVRVAKGAKVDTPIHVISLTTTPAFTHPRVVVIADAESRMTLLETHAGAGADGYATIPVTEVLTGERAHVRHLRIQRHSDRAVHIGALAVKQEAESRFSSTAIDLGARLARNELHLALAGERAYCDVGALYAGRGVQVVDNHTRLDHAMPHCESHQLFKGILDDESRGIFDGKIHVHRDAQKTDAKQTARNLLLSDSAVSNNKPQLEIYADDVKCTHGATTGQLDADQIFYLRARGLHAETARSLLTYAFGREVIDRIELAPVRERVDREILGRLPMGEFVGDAL